MVIVYHRTYRLVKYLSLVSFILYTGTQLQTQLAVQPLVVAPYYPDPVLIFLFFAAHGVLQVYWLWSLFGGKEPQNNLLNGTDEERTQELYVMNIKEVVVESSQMAYIPFYIVGNVWLACASYLWSREVYIGSQMLYIASVAAQIYAVFILLGTSKQYYLSQQNILTHLVAKSYIGLGMLYVWKGWIKIDSNFDPSSSDLIQSALTCLLLTIGSGPDPTLGICIIYDLIALIFSKRGVSGAWRQAFIYNIIIVGMAMSIDLLIARSRGVPLIQDGVEKEKYAESSEVGEEVKDEVFLIQNPAR